MLDGVTPVPADFAARYRERGYWADQPLFEGFTGALARYAGRTALVDEAGSVTYRELSDRSAHLARILLDLGFGPLDRIILQLPNTAMFAYLYFALQRIGAAPVLALPGHRKREITQFAEISGARALAVPAAGRPRLRLHRDGGRGHGVEPGPGAVPGPGRGRTAARRRGSSAWKTCWNASRGPRGRPRPGPHRPGRPGAVPALRRHDRDPQAHPPDPQRLPVQLEDRRGRLRARRGRRAARRAADRAQPAARLPGHAGLSAERRDRRAGHEHPAPGRVRADPAAPGHAHPPGARAADPLDRRPGHRRVRPVLPAGDPERRAAAPAGGQAARGARPARLLHPGELRHGRGPDHVRPVHRPAGRPPRDLRPAGLARRRGLPGGRGRERGPGRRARRADRPRSRTRCAATSAHPSTTRGRSPRTGSTGPGTCCGRCRPATTWSRAGSRT